MLALWSYTLNGQQAGAMPMREPAGTTIAGLCLLEIPVLINHKMLLRWKYTGAITPDFYIIERSTDGFQFQTMGVLRPNNIDTALVFADEDPVALKNYYRVRAGFANGLVFSSVTVAATGAGFFCKIYPNPVDKILIVRSEMAGELVILDGGGRQRIKKPVQPGLQSLDLSLLEKGIYIISITDQHSRRVYREKLLKD